MKIKFVWAIVSFFFITIAISSCLDSNDEVEYSSDDTIRSFALDTIYGVEYKFTIDQVNRRIYNVDSLPVSSDTIINKTLVKTLSTNAYYITTGDTLYTYNADTVDLSNTMKEPFRIKVHAADGIHSREYSIEVRRHLTDPDSLVWKKLAGSFSNGEITGAQKTVILGENILTYSSEKVAYSSKTSDGKVWQKATVSGLPADSKLSSILNFKDVLYIATGSGKVFRSANGLSWSDASIGGSVHTLLSVFPDYIAGIVKDNGVLKFAVTNAGMSQWVTGADVPATFPTENISYTSFQSSTGLNKYMLTGKSSNKKATIPWFSFDGKDWADLQTTSSYYCPAMEHPTILYYDSKLYLFGSGFDGFYTSIDGIVWKEVEKKVRFPEEFGDRSIYSTTVDKDNYIWIVWSKSGSHDDEVWKGRINRLGF